MLAEVRSARHSLDFAMYKLSGSGLNQLLNHSCAMSNNTVQKLFYLAVMHIAPFRCMWESCMGGGVFLWAQISSQSIAGLSIFDQYRPVCICTAVLHCLFPPLWSLVQSSGLQWKSAVWVSSCGAVTHNSFFFFIYLLNDGTIWMGRTEGTEQNRNNSDHLKEIDDKKIADSQNHWSAYQGEREERHRTSWYVVKNLLWCMYLISVKLFSPLF